MNYSMKVDKSKMITDFPSYGSGYSTLTPKYIMLHDTAGASSALAEANRLQSESQYERGIAHYYVDEDDVYQLIYDNIKAYHANDGCYGKGNGQSISIEVCRSLSYSANFSGENTEARYLKALDRAYQLAADLAAQYNINPQNILQHRMVDATSCPYTQMRIFGDYTKALANAKKKVTEYTPTGCSNVVQSDNILDLALGEVVTARMTDTAYKMDSPNWSKAVVKFDDYYDVGDVVQVKVVSTQTGPDNTVSAQVLKVLDNARTTVNDSDYSPLGYNYITLKGNVAFKNTNNRTDNKLINKNDKCIII